MEWIGVNYHFINYKHQKHIKTLNLITFIEYIPSNKKLFANINKKGI